MFTCGHGSKSVALLMRFCDVNRHLSKLRMQEYKRTVASQQSLSFIPTRYEIFIDFVFKTAPLTFIQLLNNFISYKSDCCSCEWITIKVKDRVAYFFR